MALNLYRRHREACEGGHAFDSRSGEFDERKKTWKRCACLIFTSGTLYGKFSRKSTDTSQWTDARRIADEYQKAGSWTGTLKPAPVAHQTEPDKTRCTVVDALKAFV